MYVPTASVTSTHTVFPVVFPVPTDVLIWLRDGPQLFHGNVRTYRSCPSAQRNVYLLFVSVKNGIIGLHGKE